MADYYCMTGGRPCAEGDGGRELFERIHRTIVDNRLFLDPTFSREKYIRLGLINKNRVAALLRRYAGTSLTGYINGLRLDYAAQLLRERPLAPIKAIAADAGFNNIRTFYRLFVAKYGVTPTCYKERQ